MFIYKKILVPLDGSKLAEVALPHAESLAKQYDAELVLLTVATPPIITGHGHEAMVLLEKQTDKLMQDAELYLKGLKGQFTVSGIKTIILVKYGSVVESIIEIADSQAVDLVLIASHGRTGLTRVFFGSVAAGVLNRIEQPLMVIRSAH
jgi:nucleotide-binding universal stress UspA family protein